MKSNKGLFEQLANFENVEVEDKFYYLQTILVNKQNITNIDDMIKKFYRYNGINKNVAHTINSKIFMSAWMVVFFPDIILSRKRENIKNDNEYPNDIYYISLEFINWLAQLNNNTHNTEFRRLYTKKFNQYSNAITYFLNRDKNEKINQFVREYCQTNLTIEKMKDSKKYDGDEKDKCITEVTKTKSIILKNILRLDKTINVDELEFYANLENAKEKN